MISGKPPKNYLCISPLQNAECGLRNARKHLIKEEGHFQNPPNQKNKAYEEILLSPKHNTYSLKIPIRISWLQSQLKNNEDPILIVLKLDLLLPATNGDSLGEAIISV